jgi:ActR/RegA family two-component response regulator
MLVLMSIAGKLLIIDDSQVFLDRIKVRLQREGYSVVTSSVPVGRAWSCPLAIS